MTDVTYCKALNHLDGWYQHQLSMFTNVAQKFVGLRDRPQTCTKA